MTLPVEDTEPLRAPRGAGSQVVCRTLRKRAATVVVAYLFTGIALGSCAGLEATVPPAPTAQRLSDATSAIALPAGWTPTQTHAPSATASPTFTPTVTLTPTPRPTFTPKPVLTPTAPFAVEGASTDDIVAQAFAAYLRKDENTLLRLYTKEAANVCALGFGSITQCIDAPYRIRNLRVVERWYLLADAETADDSWYEVETVITQWAGDDNLWMHGFFVELVDGSWLVSQPWTKIDVYEE